MMNGIALKGGKGQNEEEEGRTGMADFHSDADDKEAFGGPHHVDSVDGRELLAEVGSLPHSASTLDRVAVLKMCLEAVDVPLEVNE